MGILLFELFRNPLFMGILNKWETLVILLYLCRNFRRYGIDSDLLLIQGRTDLLPSYDHNSQL